MDLKYTAGIDGNLNNKNSSFGGSFGLKMNKDSLAMSADTGFDFGAKEGFNNFIRGSVSYNSDEATDYYDDGFFANGSAKFKAGYGVETYTDRYGYSDTISYLKTGETYTGEVGLRFNSYSTDAHTNVSVFDDYNKYDGNVDNTIGVKYELNDGMKSMFAKAGVNTDDKGCSPYIGIGARLALGF